MNRSLVSRPLVSRPVVNRPVVIVDPSSSGVDLAPAFQARGIPAIAVTLKNEEWPEFGAKLRAADFLEIIADQPDLINLIRTYNPIAIIPGTEEAITLSEQLTDALLPHLGNDPAKSLHRSHKAFMQKAVADAGLPSLKTRHTASEKDVQNWIKECGLQRAPLIVKPPMSSGSEMVFHIPPGGEWKRAFHHILNEPSVISKTTSKTVVIQEQAIGQEFAVGMVSVNGQHHLAHLIQYKKTCGGDRQTVYAYVEFIPFDREKLGDLLEYTKNILDALGVHWGATHTEIMLTKDGPRLIETSARMIGGPVVEFARVATGSSQADKLVEIYADGDVNQKEFVFQKTVVPVFLRAANAGTALNLEALNEASDLPTLLSRHVWIKNGDHVPQTIDYLTSIGIIALHGDRDAIFTDVETIRAMESKLIFKP